ncbi:MAG TPA: hypothetical protein VFH09_04280 [Nitrososphaera sp.]|nr:hypothetical protein [Nitrososphaera sp.]
MNTFEVAVLRVLIKRQQSLRLSTLVNGFPDNCEDNVLSAISNLKLQGYIILHDYQPNGSVSINRERRKEILQIVDSEIYSSKLGAPHAKEKSGVPIKERKSLTQLATRYPISQGIRAIGIASLLIVGLVSALGISMPTTSPDTEFVAYHQYIRHEKWSNAHGAGDQEGDMISASPYPASSASFVALKECNQKPLQQQT